MDNAHRYGFRLATGRWSNSSCPAPELRIVATAYQAQDDGAANNVDLHVGDPVKLVSDGSVALANTTDNVYGVIVGVHNYLATDHAGQLLRFTSKLPGGTVWGTNLENASQVYVQRATDSFWEIDVDDKVTATTKTAYIGLIGNNANHTCPGDTTEANDPKADPYLDISSAATTATLDWRIVGVSDTVDNRDFAGSYVKLIVAINVSTQASMAATPVAGT